MDEDRAVSHRIHDLPSERLENEWLRTFVVLLGAVVVAAVATYALRGLEHVAILAAYLAWMLSVARVFGRGALTVGADGVHVGWRGHARFFPASTIVGTAVVDQPLSMGLRVVLVRIDLRGGESARVVVAVGFGRAREKNAYARATLIAQQIESIRDDGPPRDAPIDVELLERPSGNVASWVRALRAHLRRPDTFREDVGTLATSLWSVLEDARRAPRARGAAAIALASLGDEPSRLRLAGVAETTAIPALRRAIDGAVRDDELAMRRALDGLVAVDVEDAEPAGLGRPRLRRGV